MLEPIGTAMSVVTKGLGEVATPKLREKLLSPAFTALGEYLGLEATDWVERRRAEKQAKNIHAHLAAIATLPHRRSLEDVSTDPEFEEWLEGASKVDGELDPALADFWRAGLAAMADGDPARRRMLRIVQTLSADDAVFLASGRVMGVRFQPPANMRGRYIERLEKAEVVETIWQTWRSKTSRNLVMIATPIILYASIVVAAQVPGRLIPAARDSLTTLALPTALLSLLVFAVLLIDRLGRSGRTLTSDGLALMSRLAMVRAQIAKEQSTVPAEEAPVRRKRKKKSDAASPAND